ncbi:MAG: hypothetical protein ACK4P4_22255, partial [Allorhizobium sp.]
MVLGVPAQMAPLAKSSAPLWVRVALVVIHVSDRQNDLAAGIRVRLSVLCSAVRMHGRSLATVVGAIQQGRPESLPFLGVSTA